MELGIQWQSLWDDGDKIYWGKIPKVPATQLRQASKDHQARCQRLKIPRKHKYVYIRGKTRGETLKLLKLFSENNSGKKVAYPKTRGPNIEMKGPVNLTSQSEIEIKNEEVKENLHGQSNNNGILPQKLTKRPTPCWPSNKRKKTVSKITMPQVQQTNKKFYSIKEVSQMYGIGQWLIYQHIKTDPTFPYVNVGIKKKLLIDLKGFEQWLLGRSKKNNNEKHHLLNANELMEVGA